MMENVHVDEEGDVDFDDVELTSRGQAGRTHRKPRFKLPWASR